MTDLHCVRCAPNGTEAKEDTLAVLFPHHKSWGLCSTVPHSGAPRSALCMGSAQGTAGDIQPCCALCLAEFMAPRPEHQEEHLNNRNLNIHESLSPHEMHPRVMRELADTVTKLLLVMLGQLQTLVAG